MKWPAQWVRTLERRWQKHKQNRKGVAGMTGKQTTAQQQWEYLFKNESQQVLSGIEALESIYLDFQYHVLIAIKQGACQLVFKPQCSCGSVEGTKLVEDESLSVRYSTSSLQSGSLHRRQWIFGNDRQTRLWFKLKHKGISGDGRGQCLFVAEKNPLPLVSYRDWSMVEARLHK